MLKVIGRQRESGFRSTQVALTVFQELRRLEWENHLNPSVRTPGQPKILLNNNNKGDAQVLTWM